MSINNKSIGIVGGAGPMAGILLCEYIIRESQIKFGCKDDSDFPQITLLSIPFKQMLEQSTIHKNERAISDQLCAAIDKLSSQCDQIAIACNTLHGFIDIACYPKLFDMIAITQARLQQRKIYRPLVLGTSTSFKKQVHTFANAIMPAPELQIQLDLLIDSVLQGDESENNVERFDDIVKSCIAVNYAVDGVVLACSEFSVLLRQRLGSESLIQYGDMKIPVIDPIRLIASQLCQSFFVRHDENIY